MRDHSTQVRDKRQKAYPKAYRLSYDRFMMNQLPDSRFVNRMILCLSAKYVVFSVVSIKHTTERCAFKLQT